MYLTCVLKPYRLQFFMLKSFKHKLKTLFYTANHKGVNPKHSEKLIRILDRLNSASVIKDMNYPGSNLHPLSGDKKGQFSVSISGNWRVFFEFIDGHAYIVNYDDYH